MRELATEQKVKSYLTDGSDTSYEIGKELADGWNVTHMGNSKDSALIVVYMREYDPAERAKEIEAEAKKTVDEKFIELGWRPLEGTVSFFGYVNYKKDWTLTVAYKYGSGVEEKLDTGMKFDIFGRPEPREHNGYYEISKFLSPDELSLMLEKERERGWKEYG